MSEEHTNGNSDGIAIIGMAGRFPGARNIEEFWTNLKNGVESVTFFSDDELRSAGVAPGLLNDPGYIKAKAILDDVDAFDAWFFGFTPREAEITDPQHRVFLECAWEALEHAGYDSERYPGPIGIYAGAGINTYLLRNLSSNRDLIDAVSAFQTSIHNKNDHLSTRIAYLLNLRGPSITVQTACSTSLVAVCTGCQSLLSYQCDMVLAGGVTITLPQASGYLYQEGGIGSPDGHCRAFDAKAAGTLDGNGAGVVVLKRLEDALTDGDTIHAVIKGTAINNDGSHKAGYTAPSLDSQAEVIAMAQAMAGFDPESISYVEAHGTATPLGDPIEIAALTKAFRLGTSRRRGFCAVGSVKTNIGHLDAAAGVTGLIKTVLALKHELIPPSLHFEQPNPRIDFANSPFYVNSKLLPWKKGANPRRAGVSSFGIGGTNAHAVLEEAPETTSDKSEKPWELLLISAKSSAALEKASDNLADFLDMNPAVVLADVAYTLQVGRGAFNHRRAVLCREREDAIKSLRSLDYEFVASRFQEAVHRPITFMFPGQGTQYVGMAKELYQVEPLFRKHVDTCAELLKDPLELDLRELLYPPTENDENSDALDRTALTQPALFVVEYALAKLWMDWGVTPTAMIGHSIGEYVAATLAGVMSLEEALELVAFRGKLVQGLPGGAMLAVTMPENGVLPMLDSGLSLAAVNGPSVCVVSGSTEAVNALEEKVNQLGIVARRLQTSHAFHSQAMDPVCDAFTERVRQIKLRPPEIPYISNVTGTWISAAEATDPGYWTRHLRQTVRFSAGVGELLREPEMVLLEVGPGRSLKTATRWHPSKTPTQVVETSLPRRDEQQSDFGFLLTTVGKLWLAGVEINWQAFYGNQRRRRIPLPTYPFERRSYWVEDRSDKDTGQVHAGSLRKKPDVADWFYVPVWKEMPVSRLAARRLRNQPESWLVFGGAGSLSETLGRRLEKLNQNVVTVVAGVAFTKISDQRYEINPENPEDFIALLKELHETHRFPDSIVHLWNANGVDTGPQSPDDVQRAGFYSLLSLAQAVGKQSTTKPIKLTVVTNSLHEVTGDELLCAEKATVLGPCRVIPREYPQITCRSLDVTLPAAATRAEDQLVDQLIAETVGETVDPVSAFRGGRKWVQHFAPMHLGKVAEDPFTLKEQGVYLITGGLGGIGLVLAESLAQAAGSKLVLCGRSPFPGRDTWDRWLAEHHDQDATSVKIRKLRRLEETGSEIMVATADVTSEAQMRELITRAVETFGQLNGVIHAAGIPGGGLMQLRTPAESIRVLAPKVAGARVLESVVEGLDLDFFVLCSSLSSLVGHPGQSDYCAANAFLDALAREHSKRTGTCTVAINWGEWQNLGMAAGDLFTAPERVVAEIRKLDHPLLERCVITSSGEEIYSTDFNVHKQWVLDEHRLVGNAVIPGVAYFEMIRAALGERSRNRMIELHDVYFVGPLHVRDDQTREVRLILQPNGNGFDFSLESEGLDQTTGTVTTRKYALGKVKLSDPVTPGRRKLDDLRATCNVREEVFSEEEREDDLGPRWQSIKKAYIGPSQVLTTLELSEDFANDFVTMDYHPALMDRAVGRAKEYLFAEEYLPVSYKSLKIHAAIPRRIHSYAVYRENDDKLKETLSWDTVVLNDEGFVLVEVEGFVQKRINDAAITIKSYASTDEHERVAPQTKLIEKGSFGGVSEAPAPPAREEIKEAEGAEAFRRIISHRITPQVAVSVRDLLMYLAQADLVTQQRLEEEFEKPRVQANAHPRPNLRTKHVAARNESEIKIAAIWEETLGIEQVGVDDNFFELGGDSVQAILIIAALNKAGFALTPQEFFQYQTVAELAQLSVATPGALSEPAHQANLSVTDQEQATDSFTNFPLANLNQGQFDKLSRLIAEADQDQTNEVSTTEAVGPAPLPVIDEGATLFAEIEKVLRQHPAVMDAVVLRQGSTQSEAGAPLIAYVVVNESGKSLKGLNGLKHDGPMQFSLFYFADDKQASSQSKYRLFLEGAKFADQHNFKAVWTPERHFHSSGGLYPSPSVLSAALATITQNVRLCAGSVVLPLHHPLRVAEEWAVVDNLSNGRVGVSFTSGWIPNDFVFYPDHYANKRGLMFDGIEQVKRLWRGESMRVADGAHNDVDVKIFPQPIQAELPMWLTCSGDPEMFVKAGELGLNVLTALLTQSVEETASKIALYRKARADHGYDPESGVVTLMIHTFVGEDHQRVIEKVRTPLCNYLKSHIGLVETMVNSLNLKTELDASGYLDDLISFAFERYTQTASLIGSEDKCLRMIERLHGIGVDEVACFVDFGLDVDTVMAGLPYLDALKNTSNRISHASPTNDTASMFSSLLAKHVRERMAEEMVPAIFRAVDILPLRSDGTIDRELMANQQAPIVR